MNTCLHAMSVHMVCNEMICVFSQMMYIVVDHIYIQAKHFSKG